MEGIPTQPRRKIRRVRLIIAYLFLLTWVMGTLLFTTILGHPIILMFWLIGYTPLGMISLISLLIPLFEYMYKEEKVAVIMLLVPLVLVTDSLFSFTTIPDACNKVFE